MVAGAGSRLTNKKQDNVLTLMQELGDEEKPKKQTTYIIGRATSH